MLRRKKGFTLIELLIVVAIIAILAAIAIPNFLAAQVRSKVSRTKSDLRTLATAIESYYVDNNNYPLIMLIDQNGTNIAADPWIRGNASGSGIYDHFFSLRNPITSPIAYITSEPLDPFHTILAGGLEISRRYCYGAYDSYQLGGADPNNDPSWMNTVFGGWRLFGSGPDFDRRDIFIRDAANSAMTYDPTNGTISNGDILRSPRSPAGERPFTPGVVE